VKKAGERERERERERNDETRRDANVENSHSSHTLTPPPSPPLFQPRHSFQTLHRSQPPNLILLRQPSRSTHTSFLPRFPSRSINRNTIPVFPSSSSRSISTRPTTRGRDPARSTTGGVARFGSEGRDVSVEGGGGGEDAGGRRVGGGGGVGG